MDKKKIAFIGKWSGFDLILDILREKYEVEISDAPDYVIVSPLCAPLEYMKYDCVRILFTGEPFVPDFNVFDYAIGFDYISCLDLQGNDRYFRFPLCFCKKRDIILKHIHGMDRETAEKKLKEKKYFCNFIFSHQSARGERELLFEIINNYRRVESAGSYRNNMPDNQIVSYHEKLNFLSLCKFTIAAESICSPGFVTEKIMDPICSSSIPIYFGNPFICDEFNNDAIINCMEYEDISDVISKIVEVDTNDDLYIKMLMSPKCINDMYYENLYAELKEFVRRIFSESGTDSYRRMNYYSAGRYQDVLKESLYFQDIKNTKLIKLYTRVNKNTRCK